MPFRRTLHPAPPPGIYRSGAKASGSAGFRDDQSWLVRSILEAAEGKSLFALVWVDDEIVGELVLKAKFMVAATRTDMPTGGEPT